jgi:hypothetical protein
MSKAYPSNLSGTQYELLSDLIPEPKLGGRSHSGDVGSSQCNFLRPSKGVRVPSLVSIPERV